LAVRVYDARVEEEGSEEGTLSSLPDGVVVLDLDVKGTADGGDLGGRGGWQCG